MNVMGCLGLVGLGVCAALSGCSPLVRDFDEGTGGSGGEDTGGAPECVDDEDCVVRGDPCHVAVCDAGACGRRALPAGTVPAAQVEGDCLEVVCEEGGARHEAPDDGDVPDDGEVCTADACDAGRPVHTPRPGEPCGSSAGGAVCNELGMCAGCASDADCDGTRCTDGICQPPTCSDAIQNGTEAGVDCGGACPPCDLPDLVVRDITRSSPYYYVEFCNVGSAGGADTFTVLLTNLSTGESFESNPLYPFAIPPPGACEVTGGLTCGLIGDARCDLHIPVLARVDPQAVVAEASEGNNERKVEF
ncbi:hypothetical protein [Sorangium sp. So ce131]|uniref:hypothetical protein n=1 Tax=Sorangium sp. So ce131 TaxID=3133282 RepID=UPI003F5D807E